MAGGDIKRRIAGKFRENTGSRTFRHRARDAAIGMAIGAGIGAAVGSVVPVIGTAAGAGFGAIYGFPAGLAGIPVGRIAVANVYSGLKGAYRIVQGRKSLHSYGDPNEQVRDFDALRQRLTQPGTKVRMQLNPENHHGVLISFRGERARYECPAQRVQDEMYRKLVRRTPFLNPFAYDMPFDHVSRYIDLSTPTAGTEQQAHQQEIDAVSQAVNLLPDGLREQIQREVGILPLPLRQAYVTNALHIVNAGGGALLAALTPNLPQKRQLVTRLGALAPQEILRIASAPHPQVNQMLTSLLQQDISAPHAPSEPQGAAPALTPSPSPPQRQENSETLSAHSSTSSFSENMRVARRFLDTSKPTPETGFSR